MLFQSEHHNPRGHRLSPDYQSFHESWKMAQQYQLAQSEAEKRIQKQLREAAVDPPYIKLLSARITDAEKILADLSANLKGRHLKPRRTKKR